MNPCFYGLKCPYQCYTDDCEMGCTYPKPAKFVKEEEPVAYSSDCDCGICDCDSQLWEILNAYEWGDNVKEIVDSEIKRMDEQYKKDFEPLKKSLEWMKRVREAAKMDEKDRPICERCGSHNMKVITDELDFYGWWKCYDCGNIGDKIE